MKTVKIAIIGCGGWGTALAMLLARADRDVTVWGVEPEYISEVQKSGRNPRYLDGFELPKNMRWTSNMEDCVPAAEVVVMATPTLYMRSVCERLAGWVKHRPVIVNVAKGIEEETLLPGSGIVRDVLGEVRLAGLYGPSHAEEVARGLPTTVVATSSDGELAEFVQHLFFSDSFRVYTNTDVVGVELGAALKNVIAVAAGICDGLGLGDNAKSALVTRGLAEITRLGVALGARRDTFSGLTGLGDLITTCYSPFGRNRAVGLRIGKGERLQEIVDSMAMVAEGVRTAKGAKALSARHKVDTPITDEVCRVLFEDKSPLEAVGDLMRRSPKAELDDAR